MKEQAREFHGSEQVAVGCSGINADAEGREEWGGKRGMAEDDPFSVIMFLGKKGFPDLAQVGDVLLGQGLIVPESGVDKNVFLGFPKGQQRSKEISMFPWHEVERGEFAQTGAAITFQGFSHANTSQIGKQGLIATPMVFQQKIFVVSHERDNMRTVGPQLTDLVKHPTGVGAAIQIIPQKYQSVLGAVERKPVKQELELVRTTVYVADGENFAVYLVRHSSCTKKKPPSRK